MLSDWVRSFDVKIGNSPSGIPLHRAHVSLSLFVYIPMLCIWSTVLIWALVQVRSDIFRHPYFWNVLVVEIFLGFMVKRLLSTRAKLDIDQAGVRFVLGGRSQVYHWDEIDGVRVVTVGKRIGGKAVQILKKNELPPMRNTNLIVGNLGIAPEALVDLIEEGRDRWA